MQEVIRQRTQEAFLLEAPIADYARSCHVSLELSDSSAQQLCDDLLFSLPLCFLASVMTVVCDRLMDHANLVTRFPVHMKVCLLNLSWLLGFLCA